MRSVWGGCLSFPELLPVCAAGCGWHFGNRHGLAVHKGKYCKFKDYFEVDKILVVKNDIMPVGLGSANFLIKWKGYGHEHNLWVPYKNVTKCAITEYLQNNGKYDYAWAHRCKRSFSKYLHRDNTYVLQ